MNHVLKVHEELLKTYERLGMDEYVQKEKDRIQIIKDYYGIKDSESQQLEIKF